MKRRIVGVSVFVSLILLSLTIQSCAKKEMKEEAEKKETVKVAEQNISFEMSDVCRGCHPLIYDQWQISLHPVAFVDPLYWAEAELAGKEAGEEVRNFCHSCHAAAATMIEKIPADANQASQLAKSGVICDLCHTIVKVNKIGNKDIEVETASRTKRGPYKNSFSPYHLTEYSELHTKAEFCASCHNVYHPVNGLVIENPYGEWKEGPYAKQGIVCQDCHMTPGPQVTKPNPGTVAVGGPHREHYYTHSTVGANAFITQYLGNQEGYKIAVERLKSAAKLEILDAKVSADRISFKVKIENVGAGHYLPTGLTIMRQMWLHVVVKDATGRILYENGKLDEKGNVPEDARMYNTVYADKNGKPTLKVWEAEKILKDKRIPPKGHSIEEFEFTISGPVKRPIQIYTELLYRSAPQHLVDKLLKDKPKVPVIQMTAIEKKI